MRRCFQCGYFMNHNKESLFTALALEFTGFLTSDTNNSDGAWRLTSKGWAYVRQQHWV